MRRVDKVINRKSGKSSIVKKIPESRKSELYGFGKSYKTKEDKKTDIHARKIANPVNMWSIKEHDLAKTLENEKKNFDLVLKKQESNIDPSKTLYLKNLEIEKEFMARFEKDFPEIDAIVDALVIPSKDDSSKIVPEAPRKAVAVNN